MVVRILEYPMDLEKVARSKSGSFLCLIYCYANCHENVTILLKILEIHSMDKTEKPLQTLRFLRFNELTVKPTFMFPKP